MEMNFTKRKLAITSDSGNRIAINDPIFDIWWLDISEEEAKANARLLIASPEMFYHIVVLAYNEGWAYLYDIIQKVTGKEYRFGTKEMKLLYKEANKELIKLRKLE